jgi:pimeloyl-ACP methyl ester carboxylesterase
MEYSKRGEGPLLIYVPGLDGTGQLFFRQIQTLSTHYSVVTFPLRQSLPFDYYDLVQDVIKILDHEKAEKATIVAESFGGTIALQFALDHPDRIEHLVLVNTFPFFRRRTLLRIGSLLLPLAFTPLLQVGRRLFLKPLLLNEQVDENAVDRLFEFSLTQSKEAYRQRMKLISQFDIRKQLSSISAPVTFVASGRDKLLPSVREARFMSAKIRGSRIVILNKHGHACLLSNTFSLESVLNPG